MRWTETTLSEAVEAVDYETGIIRGVRICGRKSANGREYSEQALQDAARLYEGVRVNYDHPSRKDPLAEREFGDFAGELHNCRYDKSLEATFGDFHVALQGRHCSLVLESASRFPKSFGLSHVASGDVTRKNGRQVVEMIDAVESVDIVTRPATNEGIFESLDPDDPDPISEPKTMKIREILTNAPERTKFRAVLVEMIDAGELAPELEVEAEPEASPEEQIKKGVMAAIVARLEKASPEELQAVLEQLGIEDSLTSGNNGGGDEEVEESRKTSKLERRLALMEATNDLLAADVEATPERVEAIAAVKPESRKSLIESWPKRHAPVEQTNGRRQRPASSPPLTESINPVAMSAWDAKVARATAKIDG